MGGCEPAAAVARTRTIRFSTAIFLAFTAGLAVARTVRPPNVVLIVSDNQPPDTIRALGNTYIETPNLDRLVREGSVFTRAITANPHCIPSRAEIISGASGFRNRSRPFGRGLDANLALWPQTMRQAGYHTWHTGKWDTDGTPSSRGYEETRALLSAGGAGNLPQSHPTMRNGRPVTGYRGYTFKNQDNQPEPGKGVGLTPLTDRHIADGALELIARHPQKPFFLVVNFAGCHDPLLPGPGFENKYDPRAIPLPRNFLPAHPFDWGNAGGRDELLLPSPLTPEDVKQELADIHAVISHLDAQIGRLLDALRDNGADGNTIVIFITDNGAGVGRHGIRGYQNMYEHAIGVPLIMRGPGIPANTRFAAQTYLRDLYPTICDLVGIITPATVEGRSLVPVLTGRAREIYPEVYGYWHNAAKTAPFPMERMVRTDRWKLIYYSHLDRHQLFDLENDPFELRDHSNNPAHASVRADLQRKLDAWFTPRLESLSTAAAAPPRAAKKN
jgi:arylsulfatase A-like enzyme